MTGWPSPCLLVLWSHAHSVSSAMASSNLLLVPMLHVQGTAMLRRYGVVVAACMHGPVAVMDNLGHPLQGTRGIVLLERIADDGGAADIVPSTDDVAVLENVLHELQDKTSTSSGDAVACTSSSGVEIR